MKKMLLLIFMAVLMTVAQTSNAAAFSQMDMPNSDILQFYAPSEFDGQDSLVITFISDGTAYAEALDINGLPDFNRYEMVYLTFDGILECTVDGVNWFVCP
jgi:hypothetical protein